MDVRRDRIFVFIVRIFSLIIMSLSIIVVLCGAADSLPSQTSKDIRGQYLDSHHTEHRPENSLVAEYVV